MKSENAFINAWHEIAFRPHRIMKEKMELSAVKSFYDRRWELINKNPGATIEEMKSIYIANGLDKLP